MEPLQQIETEISPREVLLKAFNEAIGQELNIFNNETGYEMPIKGGWGYSKDNAVIIDKFDSVVDQNIPFNGVNLEYIFARYRAYLEMITFRDEDKRFSGIDLKLDTQKLIQDDTGTYDKLIFNITALPDKDFEELKNEWETNLDSDTFDEDAHWKKREEKTVHFQREYWFEISSFYGQNIGNSNHPSKNIFLNQFDKLSDDGRNRTVTIIIYIFAALLGVGIAKLLGIIMKFFE